MSQHLNTSLNFVPMEKRRQIRKTFVFMILEKAVLSLFVIIIFFSIALFGAKFLLENKVKALETSFQENAARLSSKNSINISQAIKDLNQMTTRLQTMQKDFIYWSSSINQLQALIPDGVTVSSFSISSSTKQAVLNGTADSRTSFSTFKTNLSNSKYISKSEFPISLDKTNIPFTANITFTDSFFVHE